jgi:hypothetical protein
MGSGKAIKAAIEKHGKENFVKELLGYASTLSDLGPLEIDLMRLERSKGKAEYNLHIGTPLFNNAANQLAKYEAFKRENGSKVLETYANLKNCTQTATVLCVSVKHTNRFLKESGIDLNPSNRKLSIDVRQNISDGLRARRNRINIDPVGRRKFDLVCKRCDEKFSSVNNEQKFCSRLCYDKRESKVDLLPSPLELNRLYWEENMSANQIGQIYSMSGQSVRNFMKVNNIPRRTERSQIRTLTPAVLRVVFQQPHMCSDEH